MHGVLGLPGMGVESCITRRKAVPCEHSSVSAEMGACLLWGEKGKQKRHVSGNQMEFIWDFLEWSVLGVLEVIVMAFLALTHLIRLRWAENCSGNE